MIKTMKFNWEQTGMPVALVSRLKNEYVEFKSVLNDAGGQVMQPVDAESMARELVKSGGREYVEMVRELTTALANARQELEEANRRYERLAAELARRGISVTEGVSPAEKDEAPPAPVAPEKAQENIADAAAEWDEWDRRFQALLG